MGERASGLGNGGETGDQPGESPRAASRHLEGEIAILREELGGMVVEIDRRRHELTDVRLQVRRHAVGVTVTAVALIAAAAGAVWLGTQRRARQPGLLGRMARLRQVVGHVIDRPERVAAEPSVMGKILTAAATAAVATLAKKGLELAAQSVLDGRGSRDDSREALSGWPGAVGNGSGVRSSRASTGSGVVTRATGTLATALGGVTEATLEKGSTALSALGNSMRAAQHIGNGIVKAMAAAGSPKVAQPARRSAAKPRKRSRPPLRKG